QQDVLIGSDRASFRYQAVIGVEPGRVSALRLLVPPSFEVHEIFVLHDDADRLLRWSRISDRELTVFLVNPLSGQLRLLVEGDSPIARGNRRNLPLLALANPSNVRRTVNLYQEDNVRVALT